LRYDGKWLVFMVLAHRTKEKQRFYVPSRTGSNFELHIYKLSILFTLNYSYKCLSEYKESAATRPPCPTWVL